MHTYDWMQENYPREFRFENAIVTADNVLEPAVIQEVRRLAIGAGREDWGGEEYGWGGVGLGRGGYDWAGGGGGWGG